MWHIVPTPFPTIGTVPTVYKLRYSITTTYALTLQALFTYLLTVYLLTVSSCDILCRHVFHQTALCR